MFIVQTIRSFLIGFIGVLLWLHTPLLIGVLIALATIFLVILEVSVAIKITTEEGK